MFVIVRISEYLLCTANYSSISELLEFTNNTRPVPVKSKKVKGEFGLWAVTKILKNASNKKTQRVRVTQNDPLYLLSTKNPGGQQEEEHGVDHHVQGEHYKRKV